MSRDNKQHQTDQYDLVIVGGGLVGASLAMALDHSNLRVLLVEMLPFSSDLQPSYDERTVALTYSAKLIYSAMGIWNEIQSAGAQPILDIHISNKGHFGQTHLSHKHANTEALGYVVPTRNVGQVLWQTLNSSNNIEVICPASVSSISQSNDDRADYGCEITISEQNADRMVQSRLCVICDGGRSGLSEQVGIDITSSDYSQSALLSIVSVNKKHAGRAYERFTAEGPLALLPMPALNAEDSASADRFAVIWTTEAKLLDHRLALNDTDFMTALQDTFGDRAGIFSSPSARKAYPLKRANCPNPLNGRVLVVGNSAHTVHPVAGQGFNLGLRDVAQLAEILTNNPAKPASTDSLHDYVKSRRHDTRMVETFTHSLISVFSNENPSLSILRNIGLKAVEICPPAKRFLLRRTMGMHQQQCRMAMGYTIKSKR